MHGKSTPSWRHGPTDERAEISDRPPKPSEGSPMHGPAQVPTTRLHDGEDGTVVASRVPALNGHHRVRVAPARVAEDAGVLWPDAFGSEHDQPPAMRLMGPQNRATAATERKPAAR